MNSINNPKQKSKPNSCKTSMPNIFNTSGSVKGLINGKINK